MGDRQRNLTGVFYSGQDAPRCNKGGLVQSNGVNADVIETSRTA